MDSPTWGLGQTVGQVKKLMGLIGRQVWVVGAMAIFAFAVWLSAWKTRARSEFIELLNSEGIPGAVVAIKNPGEPVIVDAYGVIGSNSQLGPAGQMTRFPLASLSKPLTAATVRALVKRGEIRLDDRISDIPKLSRLAWVDARTRNITIRQLLQHTAGIGTTPEDPMFHLGKPIGCAHAIGVLATRRLDEDPGTRIRYSNAGYCLLGVVVEQFVGNGYESAVLQLASNAAPSHTLTLGPSPDGPAREGWQLPDQTWRALGAAGGWFSDARSLALVFSTDVRDPTIALSPQAPYNEYYYGLGWRVWPGVARRYKLTHYGSLPGVFTVAVGYPDGRVALMLANGRPSNDEAAFLKFEKALTNFLLK